MSLKNLEINWTSFTQRITDLDGTNPRTINWDVPHAVYKSLTPLDDLQNMGSPQAIIPKNEFIYTDPFVDFDTTYYYRLSELRPGGESFTEQVKIHIKHHILNFDAPYRANEEYRPVWYDTMGMPVRLETLDLTKEDENGNPIEVLKDEWKWDGVSKVSEWLEFIINNETIAITMRNKLDEKEWKQVLKTVVTMDDRRNYPAGNIGDNPFMDSEISLGVNNVVEVPNWWNEWSTDVDTFDPKSWHDFWFAKFGVWAGVQNWYNNDWMVGGKNVTYDARPFLHMWDETPVDPFVHPVTDIILVAKKMHYLERAFYRVSGNEIQGIPYPKNFGTAGWGEKVIFRKVKDTLSNNARLRFTFDEKDYEVVLNGIDGLSDDQLKASIQQQINDVIVADLGPSNEPYITVDFGPFLNDITTL